jgi:thiaminase/transcriptional activator TenA
VTKKIEEFLASYPKVKRVVAENRKDWEAMYTNDFVPQAAASTLAPESFRFFTSQDVLYLKEFARVYALGASQTADVDVLDQCADHLLEVVRDEIPMNAKLHHEVNAYCTEEEPSEHRNVMASVTQGYSSWLFSSCYGAGVEATMVATLPCALSYGFLGLMYTDKAISHPVYCGWLSFFASDPYVETMHLAAQAAEDALTDVTAEEWENLSAMFGNACRWEKKFWKMALDRDMWS